MVTENNELTLLLCKTYLNTRNTGININRPRMIMQGVPGLRTTILKHLLLIQTTKNKKTIKFYNIYNHMLQSVITIIKSIHLQYIATTITFLTWIPIFPS